ncbi:hypothetical protein JCM24511_01221 [Saitozyma sp. JCM 24511]|nr:hypothetical protein JCM24511_01221 [Saitozyma sp. JCM 24511]
MIHISHLHGNAILNRIGANALARPTSIAITDVPHELSVTYPQLCSDVLFLALRLISAESHSRGVIGGSDLHETRVAILCEKGYLVPLALLGIWAAGGLAVPILPSLPIPEQSYMVGNSGAGMIVTDAINKARAEDLAQQVRDGTGGKCSVVELNLAELRTEAKDEQEEKDRLEQAATWMRDLKKLDGERRAMMLYTSGTTGRPKGVVTRHSAIDSQVSAVAETWHWSHTDNLLHILPLNHLHGIVVALLPTLWAGANVEMWERFDGPGIWRRWINAEKKQPITMFFGVPTVYSRLIQAHASLSLEEQVEASKASATLRLQVSGSAPLPESLKKTWEMEGGVGGGMILLERYGMTETGIIAATGWEEEKRIRGHVGFPLANVEIRLWDEELHRAVEEEEVPGSIQVRGPGIFNEYWNLPEATASEFLDGWFKTGDVGLYSSETASKGQLKILGRNSTDIIKSGGEKISAVEIERAILELEGMKDVAVVGVPDEEWGQVVGACVVTSRPNLSLSELRTELRSLIANYKLPRKLKLYDGEIPRNGMGKVNKKALVAAAFPPHA